jgi:hypothetical protein
MEFNARLSEDDDSFEGLELVLHGAYAEGDDDEGRMVPIIGCDQGRGEYHKRGR